MDSSSEGSTDEEEVLRLFDKEAKVIVQSETLPKKSADRYMQNYNAYKNWKEKNKNSLSTSEENNLIVYFKDLKKSTAEPDILYPQSVLNNAQDATIDSSRRNYQRLMEETSQPRKTSTINPEEANVNTEQETHEFESALIDLNWSDFEDDFTETDPKTNFK
ncbi:hypothetical protein KQX54_000100 [Cotesia glomerata]|uniref:Uncharacterized protein n=1 Tax=Cotesia glomerata TaxID=32391 RepID=A0AAV7HQC1_COTGL|nr:hypothetical protein KQX54_000100 [Cotesia glomerata]